MADKRLISPEKLGSFFKEALCNQNNYFVFSTDVVMNSWVDWCITHPEESGVDALALERFIAWDKFKGEAVRAEEEGKTTVPSILRKFFVNSLIRENASSPDDSPLFKKIINPQFRRDADSFTDWISHIISSLKLWYKTLTAPENAGYTMDEEDCDYLELYKRYSAFLEANNLYEPSWIEPDFSSEGKHYIIFYPELLEDYGDYKEIFQKCKGITIISLPDENLPSKANSPARAEIPCTKYSDSRKELRRTILRIRKLCAGGDAAATEGDSATRWDQITLNIPDLQTYRPYLERELTRYCVPYVIRAGYPLIQNTAGQIFSEIQNCFNSDFSYDSVRALILDEYIPWKEEYKTKRENLISEGNAMRCICGYDENQTDGSKKHIDIWEEALKATSYKNEAELKFYQSLKKDISALCNSNSFEAILQAWLIFKENYLSESSFSETADAIIGRCITELKSLIQLENDWCKGENSKLAVSKHYDFFITELSKKTYTPQNKKCGISVYPYKTTAGGFFTHQFVIDSSQKNLEVQYKKLSFLSDEKRKLLGIEKKDQEANLSKAFVRLYDSLNDDKTTYFSFAEDSFAGFAICHNALQEIQPDDDEIDISDFILNEKDYMLGKTEAGGQPLKLSLAQKNQLKKWQELNSPHASEEQYLPSRGIKNKINEILVSKRHKNDAEKNDKIVITQSDMKNFFPCQRRWIFSNVINLKEESLDTDLTGPFDMGNINHKILELFMKKYMESNLPLPVAKDGSFDNESEIQRLLREYAKQAIKNPEEDYSKSPLTQKMLLTQLDDISNHILDFLHNFLQKNTAPEKITKTSKTKGFGGFFVRGVELSLSGENPGKAYNYFGKLDLLLSPGLENTDSENWTIIDYKNTKRPSENSIKLDAEGKLNDFQMPMYISLIQKTKSNPDVDTAHFYSIKDASSSVAVDHNRLGSSQKDFEDEMKAFEEYSDNFAEDIINSKLEPSAEKVDIYKDCVKCNFKSVCRYNYEVSKHQMTSQLSQQGEN